MVDSEVPVNNMKQLGSHDFENIYQELGINLNKLGCVMLDTEPIYNNTEVDEEEYKGFYYIEPSCLYYTEDEDKKWINGWVAEKHPHITLLYGLMKKASDYEDQIKEVLKGWEYKKAEIEDIGFFESPYKEEPYYCIVAHIKVTPELLEGHQRLELLPHINTFAGYKPHMTIAYIKKDEKLRDELIKDLKSCLVGRKMCIEELNLGDKD